MKKIGKLKMRTVIYSYLFAFGVLIPFFFTLKFLGINPLIIGIWSATIFEIARVTIFFKVFPNKQKYLITLMGYGTNKKNLYVKSFDGKDGYTTNLWSEAMVFDERDDAFLTVKSPVFTKIKESNVGFYPTVEPKY